MRVAVLKGGSSLERTVSLRSGARVEDALERLGHDVVALDVGADLVDRLTDRAPGRRVRGAARPRRRGRDRAGAARARRRAVHGVRAGRVHPLLGQGGGQARAARRRHSDARLLRVLAGRVRGARRGEGAAGDRAAARVPDRRQAGVRRLGAGDQVRAQRGRRAGRAGRRPLVRHEGPAGALRGRPRPRGVGARRGGAAGGRGDSRPATPTTSRRATRSGRRASCARRTCRRRSPREPRSSRWRRGRCSAAAGSRASI